MPPPHPNYHRFQADFTVSVTRDVPGPKGTYWKLFHGVACSLASSRELGLSPMLQRLLSMRQVIDHEIVDAVRGCAR